MTLLTGGVLSHAGLAPVRSGGMDAPEKELQTASLADSGPVSLSSGGLEVVRREFADAVHHLEASGAKLVSVDPPMWVHDSCEEARGFVDFAEREVADKPTSSWAKLDNPGAYASQERFGIPKDGPDGIRRELRPLNTLAQKLAGAGRGFLEASTTWGCTAPVKRYTQGSGDNLPELARIGNERVLALERVHVDRNRSAKQGSDGYRHPMRLTMILSFDGEGGTYFPYAKMHEECPGVESLPTALDERSTHQGGAGGMWPAVDLPGNRGVLVRGRRGRLLVFASSAEDPTVPLYASLHQGVLIQPADGEVSEVSRMVSVIGAHGDGQYETSAFHECLEHETIETRADFFGRTVEEEATGIYMTRNSTRRHEAYQFLQDRARNRQTRVEEIIREQLRLHPELARMHEAPMQPAASTTPFTEFPEPARDRSPRRTAPRASSIQAAAAAETKPAKIYVASSCSICMADFVQPGDSADPDKQVPGYMDCGHTLCEECSKVLASQWGRHLGSQTMRCPECRQSSKTTWRPLLKDGDWLVDKDGKWSPGEEVNEPEAAAPGPAAATEVAAPVPATVAVAPGQEAMQPADDRPSLEIEPPPAERGPITRFIDSLLAEGCCLARNRGHHTS